MQRGAAGRGERGERRRAQRTGVCRGPGCAWTEEWVLFCSGCFPDGLHACKNLLLIKSAILKRYPGLQVRQRSFHVILFRLRLEGTVGIMHHVGTFCAIRGCRMQDPPNWPLEARRGLASRHFLPVPMPKAPSSPCRPPRRWGSSAPDVLPHDQSAVRRVPDDPDVVRQARPDLPGLPRVPLPIESAMQMKYGAAWALLRVPPGAGACAVRSALAQPMQTAVGLKCRPCMARPLDLSRTPT